ncbi:MAG TPA: DUF1573 domain-containing protein [Ferruginibacter sp.]|nr:DUF1573 domain-containing protein [Ferruginibacter sp.]
MKKIFTVLLATCMVAALHAQQLTTAPATAKIATEVKADVTPVVPESLLTLKEAEFDFGKIPQGKPVTHIFEVTNKSNEILKIANVQASCGCTTPEWEKEKAVAPGESTKITVGYNAAAEGPFTKFITVTYNGAQTKQITIKGEVWKTPGTSAPENKGLNDLKN